MANLVSEILNDGSRDGDELDKMYPGGRSPNPASPPEGMSQVRRTAPQFRRTEGNRGDHSRNQQRYHGRGMPHHPPPHRQQRERGRNDAYYSRTHQYDPRASYGDRGGNRNVRRHDSDQGLRAPKRLNVPAQTTPPQQDVRQATKSNNGDDQNDGGGVSKILTEVYKHIESAAASSNNRVTRSDVDGDLLARFMRRPDLCAEVMAKAGSTGKAAFTLVSDVTKWLHLLMDDAVETAEKKRTTAAQRRPSNGAQQPKRRRVDAPISTPKAKVYCRRRRDSHAITDVQVQRLFSSFGDVISRVVVKNEEYSRENFEYGVVVLSSHQFVSEAIARINRCADDTGSAVARDKFYSEWIVGKNPDAIRPRSAPAATPPQNKGTVASKAGREPHMPAKAPNPRDTRPLKPCFTLINEGFCKYGEKCYFSHDEAILRTDKSFVRRQSSGNGARCRDFQNDNPRRDDRMQRTPSNDTRMQRRPNSDIRVVQRPSGSDTRVQRRHAQQPPLPSHVGPPNIDSRLRGERFRDDPMSDSWRADGRKPPPRHDSMYRSRDDDRRSSMRRDGIRGNRGSGPPEDGNWRFQDRPRDAPYPRAAPNTRDPPRRVPQRTKPCFSFRDTGKCANGPNCPYSHDPDIIGKPQHSQFKFGR